VPAQRSRYTE